MLLVEALVMVSLGLDWEELTKVAAWASDQLGGACSLAEAIKAVEACSLICFPRSSGEAGD